MAPLPHLSATPRMRKSWLLSMLLLPAVASAQTTVYSNNFESGVAGPAISGSGSVQTTGGLSAFGFGANHFRNEGPFATNLLVSGMGAHTSLTLSISLAMWDSIDWAEQFLVQADGANLYSGGFGNYGTPGGQCEGPGTQLTPAFTSFGLPDYGYNADYHDCARTVSFTFAHTTSSVSFAWSYPGTQGGLDESFGIDNILVQTNAAVPGTTVPEPSTYAMLGLGLSAVIFARRKQRS